jgi:CheY-like chemotaxis protein
MHSLSLISISLSLSLTPTTKIGTILGATEMITGHPPSTLLMTSIYDTIHDEDILGLHAIKTQFWECDQPDVEVYIRRRQCHDNSINSSNSNYNNSNNLDSSEWTWLMVKVISYFVSPVPGMIIHETLVTNTNIHTAIMVNRVTRIASLLLGAVEASWSTPTAAVATSATTGIATAAAAAAATVVVQQQGEESLTIDDGDTAYIHAMLSEAAKSLGLDLTDVDNPLKELMTAAHAVSSIGGGGLGGQDPHIMVQQQQQQQQQMMMDAHQNSMDVKSSFTGGNSGNAAVNESSSQDPLEYLKIGPTLDLSKIILSVGEVKLIALVLTGRLQLEHVGPLLYLALSSPEMDLDGAMDEFYRLSVAQLRPVDDDTNTNNDNNIQSSSASSSCELVMGPSLNPPPLAVINLSYTEIGDAGMEALSEYIYLGNTSLKTLDISFCNMTSKGLLALCDGLDKRNSQGLSPLQALSLTGNTIKMDAAKRLGKALCSSSSPSSLDDTMHVRTKRKSANDNFFTQPLSLSSSSTFSMYKGLKLLHLGSTSISPRCLIELLTGLGPTCPLEELKLHSNRIGPAGASILVAFLDQKSSVNRNELVLPKLNRIDMSYNQLGDHGTTQLTKAISKRAKNSMTEVSLSGNDMASKGIESIMNKLLQHKLITLNLDNNCIGDQGCQLVAASLPSIPSLARLNLAFNDIGCRGMATLMRSLVGCESITSLGVSGNVMKISGAIAMGFTLAHHPRLSILELDNCCLSQVAQCHIVAGIISNRWVPMKVMHGFRAGPPMVAIGALDIGAQHMGNKECFRLRRDIQMRTLLQWMENNRNNLAAGSSSSSSGGGDHPNHHSTNDVLSNADNALDAPSQSAYLRMLDWLGRIPFDESELMDLRKYFYDVSGSESEEKSQSNLKHRGDILAALASDVVEEILESEPLVYFNSNASVGLDLNKLYDEPTKEDGSSSSSYALSESCLPKPAEEVGEMSGKEIEFPSGKSSDAALGGSDTMVSRNTMSTITFNIGQSDSHSQTSRSTTSMRSQYSRVDSMQLKARITMFPKFAAKLDNLKSVAQEMMDSEDDPTQQDDIAQQFAEASLTILRQLRYHCMESGLDGWRQGKLRRKVLIVDDSIVTRKLVARAFERANFIVDTAEDGVKGVEKMKESIYDIAFMDIDMPVMNGFDATKALRMWEDCVRPGARQPICALTAAHVEDFDRTELMRFKEAGLDVMESKPCNIPRLLKVVDDVSPMFSDLSINAIQFDGKQIG